MKKTATSAGRNLALTIILGIFIAIMITTFLNLVVSYAYPAPEYDEFCNAGDYAYPIITKPIGDDSCPFNQAMFDEQKQCLNDGGQVIYTYNDAGCPISIQKCDFCSKEYTDASEMYNRYIFYIFAIIGFALIVLGLFNQNLLIQIITLPAGAFLVIEAAVRNFDDKLTVIITFGLLIAAAIYLALKKLRN